METLSLGERRHRPYEVRGYRTADDERDHLRLPTPETSRSSNDTWDYDASLNYKSISPHVRSPYKSGHSNGFDVPEDLKKPSPRRDSRNQSAPHSPPYNATEPERP